MYQVQHFIKEDKRMSNDKKTNVINLYCLGGAGFNSGSELENFRDHQIPGAAALSIAYADTSDSDMSAAIAAEHCYFLPGTKGSGKYQGMNIDAIDQNAKAILQKFRPSPTLNILLSSASGGSGAPMVSTLAHELLADGHNVVIIMIGTTADKREIGNTRNHIRSLMNVAADTQKPIPAAYFQNTEATPRQDVNKAIIELVGSLCTLFSGENHGLDPQDLYNWLHFNENKTTSYPARLAQLGMVAGDARIGQIGNVISVATLATEKSGHEIAQTPEYQVVGRISPNADQIVISKAPIHFILSTGRFIDVLADMEGRLEELNRQRAAFVEAPVAVAQPAHTKSTRRGIVVDD
jgi:hypothetical protein